MVNFEIVTLGPKYAVRISDLRETDGHKISCSLCDHSAIIPAGRLKSKFAGSARLVDIDNKLPCGRCANRAGNSWQTVRKITASGS